jgi:hypothetical protein
MCRAILAVLSALTLDAQSVRLRVYSELQRVDPFGEILAIDRAQAPREILSPGVVRNAFASFHVAITAPRNAMYFLAVQTNPPDVLKWNLYEERFVKHADAWIPDALEEARPPYFGVIPDPMSGIPDQNTRVYLLDIWVPRETRPGGVRVELLAKRGYWRIAPMEVRILWAQAPDVESNGQSSPLPSADEPADAAIRAALKSYVAGERESVIAAPLNVRAVIRRNALQDIALARKFKLVLPQPALSRNTAGAEWYLKIRDWIYREASK